MITKLCPVEYHADAACPAWLTAPDGIFMWRQSLIDYLRRFLGYCLSGDVSEQILAIFWGVGNGKSMFLISFSTC